MSFIVLKNTQLSKIPNFSQQRPVIAQDIQILPKNPHKSNQKPNFCWKSTRFLPKIYPNLDQ